MSYYDKYLKYKTKYLRLKNKIGGDITINEFTIDSRFEHYYPYAFLFRDFVIENGIINGIPCMGDKTTITKLFAGANGMTLMFSCEGNANYVVKFNFNVNLTWGGETHQSWTTYLTQTETEFISINRFSSQYIMKAYNWFIFKDGKFTIKKNASPDSIIDLPSGYATNPNYKFTNSDASVYNKIPNFAGIILEHIPGNFRSLSKDLSYEKIKILFKQYLMGIHEMNLQNCIHNDIKDDNLMFFIDRDGNYIAKIIDIGAIYDLELNKAFIPASTYMASEDLIIMAQSLTETQPISKENELKFKEEILFRYDLYCLAYIFKHFGFTHLNESAGLSELIEQCLTLQTNNQEVLGIIDSI